MPDQGDRDTVAYKQTLNADELAALPEAARGFYKQVGSNFVPDIEGVDNLPGLTSALASERTARETAQNALKPFTAAGVTPERVTELLALEQSSRVGKHMSKGEYDTALETQLKPVQTENATLKEQLRNQGLDHKLDQVLIAAGVINDRLPKAKKIAKDYVRVADDGTYEVIGDDGKPTSHKFDEFWGGAFKKDNLFLFSGNGGAGSGSTGSSQPGAGEVPTKTRAEFAALTPQQKGDFMELVGQGKAQLVQG
jgi:hypothetical protein